jgi:Bacteriophage baseplate protein W
MSKKTFLGTGWAFPPEFNISGNQNLMVSDEEDISQSLRILLDTKPGERIMQPSFGCGIHKYVFEKFDESLATLIKEEIRIAILFYETRIEVEKIDVTAQKIIDGKLKINIQYNIKATNSRSNMVYPFYLLEGTNIIEK